MKILFALLLLLPLCALAQTPSQPATIISCPTNISLTTSAQSIASDVNARQVLISKPSVDMYFSFLGLATASTSPGSTLVPAGAVETFTIYPYTVNVSSTLSLIGVSSGTVNICWVVGY